MTKKLKISTLAALVVFIAHGSSKCYACGSAFDCKRNQYTSKGYIYTSCEDTQAEESGKCTLVQANTPTLDFCWCDLPKENGPTPHTKPHHLQKT